MGKRVFAVDEHTWVIRSPLTVNGLSLGVNTAIVGLPGGLWIHSPGPGLDNELADELSQLGEPRWLVAPNLMHCRFLPDWARRWPAAQVVAAPGLAARLPPALQGAGELAAAGMPWDRQLHTFPLAGLPRLREVVFLDRRTGRLLLTDIAFNLGDPAPLMTRLAMRLNGAWNRFGPTRLMRYGFVADRRAFADSLGPVIAAGPKTILPAHGRMVEADGAARLAEVFDWAFRP